MMRYLSSGLCPMLADRKCTIYEVRPQTCRDYDCRVFAAAGIDAGTADKHVINERIRAWRFKFDSPSDAATIEAIRAATSFIRDHSADFPNGAGPKAPTGIAVLAVKAYTVFLDSSIGTRPPSAIAQAIVDASRAFDRGDQP